VKVVDEGEEGGAGRKDLLDFAITEMKGDAFDDLVHMVV
jgi:hypothetical protein